MLLSISDDIAEPELGALDPLSTLSSNIFTSTAKPAPGKLWGYLIDLESSI